MTPLTMSSDCLPRQVKRAATGTNVRAYTGCCNTLCVTDGGEDLAPPLRSFSRTCLNCSDGTPDDH
jgi:hypothetical protein